ncbi:uncharacterized protein LOC123549520 [Mercenaria mercenaria]|uniref:uncharacterized protein LOC123549520 n=1 Tax=Mercenaria mercenaria TaxID=6596 RepID=UPI00234E5798|nr:uncharacterized protein LOC123549520 [Mercenaria mercenaria]
MSSPRKIQSDQYRNWVRGALGLFYLQQGLQDFTNNVSQNHQAMILQALSQQTGNPHIHCNQCSIRTILPVHTSGKKCIQKNIAKCNCRKKSNKYCQVCSYIYDEIIRQHRYNDPYWDVDSCQWCSDHWQIAKCFLTTSSMGTNNSAQDTDAAGLLSIIINNRFFQTEIHCQINAPYDDFCLARTTRNEILHNSTLQLKDAEVSKYLTTMIAVLEDKKTLLNDVTAKKAVESLKQISNDKLVITTELESKAIEIALKAIDEKTEEAVEKIQQTKDQIIADVKASVASREDIAAHSVEIEHLQRGHGDHEIRLQIVEKNMSEMKIQVTALENEVSSLKDVKNLHQRRQHFLQQKQELQLQLLHQYRDYVSTDVSPLLPEEEVDLSKAFVPLKFVDGNSSQRSEESKQERNISSLGDILFDESGQKFTNIYISGVAGMGKTTFCKAILFLWLNAQTQKKCHFHVVSHAKDVPDRNHDFHVIRQFDFLFYVSLRHALGEHFVEQMIIDQLLYEDQYAILENVLRKEPDKCLVILNGLDEWKPSKPFKDLKGNIEIPLRKCKSSYTIVTTTRPWKLDNIRPSTKEINAETKLIGIDQNERNSLIKSTINELNSRMEHHKHMYIFKFNDEIKRLQLHDICKTPILLKLLVCLWYEDNTLGSSYCSIYSSVINVILKHADERYKKDEAFQKLKSVIKCSQTKQLPKCFKGKQLCWEMSSLVFSLSKLAFFAFFGHDRESALVFKRDDITAFGLSESQIEISKKIGLLSVSKQLGRSAMHRYSCFSFAHKTIQEFFCAVFIGVQFEDNAVVSEEIKRNWISAERVLGDSIILKFLSGMKPNVSEILFEFISKVLVDDKEIKFRMSSDICSQDVSKGHAVTADIQNMMTDCVSESFLCGHHDIKLSIVDIEVTVDSNIAKYIPCFDLKKLKSFRLTSNRAAVETNYMHLLFDSDIPTLKVIELNVIPLSCSQLCQILLKAKHLSHLRLQDISMNSGCNTDETAMPSFETTKLTVVHLEGIELSSNSTEEMRVLTSILSLSPYLHHVDISGIYCVKKYWTHFHRDNEKWNNVACIRYLRVENVKIPVCTFYCLLCLMQSSKLTELTFCNINLTDGRENLPESCIVSKNTAYETLNTVLLGNVSSLTDTTCNILCTAICNAHTVHICVMELPCLLKDAFFNTVTRSSSLRSLLFSYVRCSDLIKNKDHICRSNIVLDSSALIRYRTFRYFTSLQKLIFTSPRLCHAQLHILVNFIRNARKLTELDMYDVICIDKEETCMHKVDFSLLTELTTVNLRTVCFEVVNCCTQHLESLTYVPLDKKDAKVDFLKFAPYLSKLELSYPDSISITTVIPTLRQLRYLTLNNVDFQNEELILSPLMRNLTEVRLCIFKMTVDALGRFMTSVELLRQPVRVILSHFDIKQSDKNVESNKVTCLTDPPKSIVVWTPCIEQNFSVVEFDSKTGRVAYIRRDGNKLSGTRLSFSLDT